MSSSQVISHETKGQKFARSFLAFALFLAIAALSLTVCIRVCFINPDNIVKVFSNEEYVNSLREDLLNYTHETLKSNMLPEDCLNDVITYKAVYDISYAYGAGACETYEEYTNTSYQDYIDKLGNDIKNTVNGVINDGRLEVDENRKADGADLFAEKMERHIAKTVEKPYMNKLPSIIKIGRTATLVAIILFALVALLLGLIVISIGKRHRAMRYIVHSVNAAAILDLALVGGVSVIERVKTLYIFPTYLRTSVMSYVNSCAASVAVSAIVLLLISLVLTVFIWKMKKDSNG